MFTLTIKTDNAAFEGDAVPEVCRILGRVQDRLTNGITAGKIFDENGNRVGEFALREEAS